LRAIAVAVLFVTALIGCGGGDGDGDGDRHGDEGSFVADVRPAIEAVEAVLGSGQEYFEVTATPRLVNVFVAIDEATAAVPYVYLGGELQSPAPALTGASGFTFTADAVDFDETTILDAVSAELPDSTIEALSIEGGDGGAVRYVVSTLSSEGGRLDVTVTADGAVLEVDPV
jgi:hypothetical protein